MNIIVFGATGKTGTQIVTQGLEAGHIITAFVRTPSKVTITHPNLKLAKGDVLDADAVDAALQGQDAILIALGVPASEMRPVVSQGTLNIVNAAKKYGVRRIVVETSYMVSANSRRRSFIENGVFGIICALFKGVDRMFADKDVQESVVKSSGLEWVIVQPPIINDGPHLGKYRTGTSLSPSFRSNISNADVADFMLKCAESPTYLGQTPTLFY